MLGSPSLALGITAFVFSAVILAASLAVLAVFSAVFIAISLAVLIPLEIIPASASLSPPNNNQPMNGSMAIGDKPFLTASIIFLFKGIEPKL